jgi:uncharacterized protein GlcG (DUF336 family)
MLISLAQANTIIDAAFAEGRKRSFAPLAAAVLDLGGNIISFQREDGAGFARFNIAYGKAWGSLGLGFNSRELFDRAQKAAPFVAAAGAATQGRMIPSPGGVIIMDADGGVVGAIGISGDTGPNDEICAIAGIEAAGFKAAPGPAA